ncbi:unnamed protein product [Calicophoron daubneyi]|uniref:Leishmanolysin-like peptidase n=1 Tax=Calicophoron daubneyi TaxID=300641 RepID=A0AAV2TND5_CALDB
MKCNLTLTILMEAVCFLVLSWSHQAGIPHLCWTPTDVNLSIAFVPQWQGLRPKTLRITPFYTSAFSSLYQSANIKSQIIEPALDFWRHALAAKNPNPSMLGSEGEEDDESQIHPLAGDIEGSVSSEEHSDEEIQCYGLTYPEEKRNHDKSGEDVPFTHNHAVWPSETDFLLLIDSKEDENCHKPIGAYATPCRIDSNLNRPIVGMLNICPGKFSLQFPDVVQTNSVIMHQLAHALGFTPVMFAFMRYEGGMPRTARDPQTGLPTLGKNPDGSYIPSPATIANQVRSWKSLKGEYIDKIQVMQTPSVLKFARSHFGCGNMDGVEMENEGGNGTAFAHFEKRIVYDEIMSGAILNEAFVSGLTLSYFQDTGWYYVNMSMAQKWTYGKGRGCDFVKKSCYEYMEIQRANKASIRPYCTVSKVASAAHCIPGRNAYGFCNVVRHREVLPPRNRYLNFPSDKSSQYGGERSLMDYCPVVEPVIFPRQMKVRGRTGVCDEPRNNYNESEENVHSESFGKDSLCIDHLNYWRTLTRTNPPYFSLQVFASCHKYKCSKSSGLIISIENEEYTCPLTGGLIEVMIRRRKNILVGEAICPVCSTVCSDCPVSGAVNTPWSLRLLTELLFLCVLLCIL